VGGESVQIDRANARSRWRSGFPDIERWFGRQYKTAVAAPFSGVGGSTAVSQRERTSD
jgi:hypothetical protein